jgi:hypothetical protein
VFAIEQTGVFAGSTINLRMIRWFGEYNLQSERGPCRLLLAADAPADRC